MVSGRYTTIQGDMWDSIAYSQLGSVSYADKVMSMNRRYREYFIFPAGIVLELPDVNPDVPDMLPPWKQVAG